MQWDKVKDRYFASLYNDASMMISKVFFFFFISSNLITLRAANGNLMKNTEETSWLSSHCSVLTLFHISTSTPWQILVNPLGSTGISPVKNQTRFGDTAQLEQVPSTCELLILNPQHFEAKKKKKIRSHKVHCCRQRETQKPSQQASEPEHTGK